jgi:altronate dehydratase small subunit
MKRNALIIHPSDNVANLIGPGSKGDTVDCTTEGRPGTRSITLGEDIPSNHKCAAVDIRSGDPIIKYGMNIGRASRDVRQGDYVHVHNIESNRGRGDLRESGS